MLKMYLEEFNPGYYIKYDGFRESNKFTVLSPIQGRVKDFSTREDALELLKKIGGYYNSKIDMTIHYPFSEKFQIVDIVKGEYKGLTCCACVKFSDGKMLAELSNQDGGGFILIEESDVELS